MKMFTLLVFSFLFIPLISYSQNNSNKKDVKDKNLVQSEGELKEDLEGRDEYFKIMNPPQPPNAYSDAVKQRESMTSDKNTLSKTSTTNWVSLSPNGGADFTQDLIRGYLSGRARAIAFDPTDSNIVYIGAAGGGVWKTTNGGTNWTVLTEGLSSIESGDILVDQRNPNIVYFGSGELTYAVTGDGLFKSTDGGATWSHPANGVTMGKQCVQLSMDPVNSNILYWAGNSGIFKSTNGGTTWTNTNSGTNATCVFVNSSANIGTAVGHNGKIRRTTDGGTTWTSQTSGTTDSLFGVYFIDPNYGTVVGKNGRVLRTTNGGTNWSSQNSGVNDWLRGVYFYNASKGWVVGFNGKIRNTTNGGSKWNAQTSGTTYGLNGVSFIDSIKGWAVGAYGTILRTTNGGTNWTEQTSGTTNTLNNVSFTDANNGTAVGVSGTILRTTNGGTNWTAQTSGTPLTLNSVSFYSSKIGKAVGVMGTVLYTTSGGSNWIAQTSGVTDALTGVSFTDPMTGSAVGASGRILRTIDGGITWTSQTSGETDQFNAIQFIFDNTNILMASFGVTSNGIIRKSTDAGATWTTLTNGLPSGSGVKRIQLAPYQNDNNIIYANIADALGTNTTGTYKTTNLGSSWSLTQSSVNYLTPQCTFNNAITVKPVSSNLVIAAGVHPYRSTDGGVNFTAIWGWDSLTFIHADVHRLAYNGYTLYGCCDGGVYKSTNDGATWINLNQTLSTFQYYHADYVDIDNNKVRGGSQDNGLIHTTNGGTIWDDEGICDAAHVCYDQTDTNYTYASANNGWCGRITSPLYISFGISPSGSTGGLFLPPLQMAPGDNNTLFFGKQSLWKTTSAKTCESYQGWTKIDSVTSGSGVYSIGISHTNVNKFYYSYPNVIKATTNNGSNWTTATVSGSVWDITVDNTNDNVAYACFNSGTNKVAKTTNGGASWTYINGNLPAAPYFSIVLRTSPSRMLFVAGNMGIYQSTDDGTTWVSFNSGLPVVKVMDLKYYLASNKLMAATYGRGIWMFDLNGLGKDVFGEIPVQYNLSENFPNPFNPQTHIQFSLPVSDNVKLTVFDVTGREVETLVNNRLNAGKFEVTFDGSKYASGVYLYRLTVGNSFVDTKKMILLK